MSRKELKAQLLHQMQCNIQIVGDNRNIVQENIRLQKEKENIEFEVAKSKFQTNLSYIIKSLENEWNTEQNETCTKTRNDTDIEFSCSINTNLPQKSSTDSIQNAIDSFEKIRWESQ